MKYLYGTYRPKRITSPYDLTGNVSLNGTYTPSFFISNIFGDWEEAGLTKLKDQVIPEDRYIGEVVPGIKKLTRFLMFEYNETYVDPLELQRSAENIGKEFDIAIQDVPTTIARIKANTNLVEVEPGKFLISEETTGLDGEIVPANYLTIA